ncbi:YvcK family protein [Clostridium sp. NSJ-49]|uniref:Putative gluconeogenesis factor n=1 Tax=Clostridium disporicum TaxID=84024 RepID=A0A174JVJ1_9CLOT|nr:MULTISPECIES: YvcK family protein [Clostridium]MBC5626094.1 YvcK family protein [Clostridium sp. NSJ-49]MCD2502992.1 YvcK family protein [Clostridium sp. NSJ-145]CUP02226.1 transporter [Clostridium disporicum]
MILDYLMKPGARIKRWVLLGFVGTILLALGVGEVFIHKEYDLTRKMVCIFLGLLGVVVIVISISEGLKSILRLINSDKINITINDKNVEDLIDDERLSVSGPKIVVVGGGTGLSTMLRGLKNYTNNITAIVTVGDDGGGSGKIREDFGMLPPGDIRNCILALADTEPIMEKLLQYRFKEGSLEGQSFGNLFLAAMAGISDNFEEAVQRMSSVLAVTGKVLPVTLDDMKLVAILENGDEIDGESRIPDEAIARKSKIKKLMINPENAKPLVDALKAIEEADAIIMGPGSLYTSIIPNLLVTDIADTICESDAIKIYISNIMTQPGETDDFTAADHLKTLINYGGKKCVDYVIANNGTIPDDIKERYLKEGSKLVELDRDNIKGLGVEIVEENLVKITKGYVKHDSEYLADIIMKTVIEKELKWDKEKILEYVYSLQKMREKRNTRE